jgi:periplasmic divalent cation tolerance protein
MPYVIVFITAPNKKEAIKINGILLSKRIVACANIIGAVDSYFWWKGRREKANECLLIAKTTRRLVNKLIRIVKSLHSYEVPEIIAMPVIAGYKPYLDWVEKETKCGIRD